MIVTGQICTSLGERKSRQDHEESAARHDMSIDYLLQDSQGEDEWAEAWPRDLMGGLIQRGGGGVNP